jgi:hypothetical protein
VPKVRRIGSAPHALPASRTHIAKHTPNFVRFTIDFIMLTPPFVFFIIFQFRRISPRFIAKQTLVPPLGFPQILKFLQSVPSRCLLKFLEKILAQYSQYM